MENESRTYFLPDLCKSSTLGILVIVAEIIAFVVLLLKPWDEITLELFGWLSLFLQWVILACAALLCFVRRWLMKLPDVIAGAISYALIVAVVVIMTALLGWLQEDAIDWKHVLKNGLVAVLIGALLIRYLYVRTELAQRAQAELEARVEALQSRIRPHFLFNSMNTIASLIMIDPEKAEHAVEDLSSLFRATLGERRSEATFAEEIDLCKKYLSMEGLRLGDRLTVEWDISGLSGTTMIPLLTLQPILENAIYHGIQTSSKPGWIRVKANFDETASRVIIVVSNSIPNTTPSSHKGQNMALNNIRARLKAIYGVSATVEGRYLEDCYVSTIIYALG
ncbi:sensor histidine kinase [Litoribrevibacter albus]|uniref:Alginate biosynthesis protein AlgZ/FimS n=1 Tax=Litoribrevibacter albus TaxID=1473156 RepID=A0AA37SEM6_9GAMM|nr:histidine kinase [Litoribrevibacter albus]GLQ33062.1 alginate biosynthesis protein AlgZ/FimS [Litoribrevibacter albus]